MEKEIRTHKVNPLCNCVKCFYKDIINKTRCSLKEVLDYTKELESQGHILIVYDNSGFPESIERLSTKKELSKLQRGEQVG